MTLALDGAALIDTRTPHSGGSNINSSDYQFFFLRNYLPVIFQPLNVTFDCVSRTTHGLVDSFTLTKTARQGRDFNPVTAFLRVMNDHRVLHVTSSLEKVQELVIRQTRFTNCRFE